MNEKVMLVDGNSIINRAFYALPVLSNKNGEYTNAVLGFLNIFFKMYEEEKPQYVVVAFDLPAPTFRHKQFEQYKGTRKSMPEELRPQLPLLKNLLKSMNIQTVELEGFEADDILGTMATKAAEHGIQAVVVSGDRDLLQIASDGIKIRIPKTKGGKTEVEDYFEKDVIEKYGVTPKQYIDVKALMGDASDNIPGVPGIGEKTALKIITEYKSVEAAVENAALIKPAKASENLIANKDLAFISKTLATIITDAPVPDSFIKLNAEDMFNKASYNEFKRLQFKSHLNRFDISKLEKENVSDAKKGKAQTAVKDFKLITDKTQASEYIKFIDNKLTAYKFIYDNNLLSGLALSLKDNEAAFIKINNGITERELFDICKPFFESETGKIALNAKSDIRLLYKFGIHLNNLVFDVMLGGYILAAAMNASGASKEHYEYNDIAFDFLGESYANAEPSGGVKKQLTLMDIMEANSNGQEADNTIPKEETQTFACRQADVIFRAYPVMKKMLSDNGQNKLYYEIELPLTYVLADMELTGIKADEKFLKEMGAKLQQRLDVLTDEIHGLADEEFNINSPKQLGVVLFDKLGLTGGKKTNAGAWSTSADILEKLAGEHEIINKILEYRTNAKLKSTYADGLLNVMDRQTGKIYSSFNQTITATGRISSSEPNLQNIPIRTELGRELRKAFIVSNDDFIFVDADYSQIELRILAGVSGDEALIHAFREGRDIHSLTASQIFNVNLENVTQQQRSYSKAVNFGIIYGISAFSLSDDIGVSVKEAGRYIEQYFKKYPKVKQYMEQIKEKTAADGYAETIFNRRRNIPEIKSSNFNTRSAGERAAMNMPIQGSAADIIKIAMVKVYKRLNEEKLKSRIVLQVHDELLIEAHLSEIDAVKRILKDEMENAIEFCVPLSIDINTGKNWYEAK